MTLKSQPIYLCVCANCRLTITSERPPPDCFTFKCEKCHYDEYELYVVKGLRLTKPRDTAKLINYRINHTGKHGESI